MKTILGTNGKHSIDENGVVYSHVDNSGKIVIGKNKIRKQQETVWGYKTIDLTFAGKKKKSPIHRLVAIHFIDNPMSKPCVNHIDGNKHNNSKTNLEWVTYSENEQHSRDVLGKRNKTKPIIAIKNNVATRFEGQNMASRALGLQQSNIHKVLSGKRAHTCGYFFKYE